MLRRKKEIDPIEADGQRVEEAVSFIETFTQNLRCEQDKLDELEAKMGVKASDHHSIAKVYEDRVERLGKAKEMVSRLLQLVTKEE